MSRVVPLSVILAAAQRQSCFSHHTGTPHVPRLQAQASGLQSFPTTGMVGSGGDPPGERATGCVSGERLVQKYHCHRILKCLLIVTNSVGIAGHHMTGTARTVAPIEQCWTETSAPWGWSLPGNTADTSGAGAHREVPSKAWNQAACGESQLRHLPARQSPTYP